MIYAVLVGVFLAPVLHEVGHECAARAFGKRLEWFWKFPRLCWHMPGGLSKRAESIIAKAGFGTEFGAILGALVMSFLWPSGGVWGGLGVGLALGASVEWWMYPVGVEESDFGFLVKK